MKKKEIFNTSLLNELYGLKDEIINLKELTPEILNRFVECIKVKADGTPKIFYRFSESSIYFSAFFSNTQHSTCLVVAILMTIESGSPLVSGYIFNNFHAQHLFSVYQFVSYHLSSFLICFFHLLIF